MSANLDQITADFKENVLSPLFYKYLEKRNVPQGLLDDSSWLSFVSQVHHAPQAFLLDRGKYHLFENEILRITFIDYLPGDEQFAIDRVLLKDVIAEINEHICSYAELDKRYKSIDRQRVVFAAVSVCTCLAWLACIL